MLKYNEEINSLIRKRQKYLAFLSKKYGICSNTVMQQVYEWLTKIDLRVYAIESVYRLIAGVDERLELKRKNLFKYMNILKHNKLKTYKPSLCQRIYIPIGKDKTKFIVGSTVKDSIVQTLFAQLLEPIIDVHADLHSYGFRKGRNPHQAIGTISKLLRVNFQHKKKINNQYIFSIKIENFFIKHNKE